MNYTEDLPALGSKAAAVASIESLIYRALAPRDIDPLQLRYWLDAYYQARFAQECEAQREQLLVAGQLCTPECKPVPEESAEETDCRVADAPRNDREEENGAEQSAPPEQADAEGGQEITDCRVGLRPPRNDSEGKKTKRPAPVGWTEGFEPAELKKGGAAEAAAFKREQRERLLQLRRSGVTMLQICSEANGCITEDQLLAIREGRRVPVAVYRELQGALDQIEKKLLIAQAAAPVSQA